MRIRFTVLEGVDLGAVYEFDGYQAFVVGRSGDSGRAELFPTDPYFSRHHMLVEVCADTVAVKDLDSRNGLFVNGMRVPGATLASGDTVKAGRTVLRVSIEKDEDPSPPPRDRAAATGDARSTGSRPVEEPAAPLREEFLTDEVTRFATSGARGASPQTSRRFSEFRLEGPGERSAMGTIHRATDPRTGATVSIRRLDPTVPLEHRALQRFLRQMEVLGTLEHPHVVRLIALGSEDGRPWFATEHAAAGDLGAWVRRDGPRTIEETLALGRQMLDALVYAHEMGVAHRDIKPTNLRLRSIRPVDGVLSDFGLSKSYRVAGGSGLTQRSASDGEVAFLAPEQILDSRAVGPPADLYSLAACLFHALTGIWHFDAPMDGPSVWSAILEAKPIPLRSRRRDAPARLAEVVDRALRRDPTERWSDASRMRAALGA